MFIFRQNLLNLLYPKSRVFRNFCNLKSAKEKSDLLNNASIKTYGQPTANTHPHLLKEGEVVPYIRRSEFQERRQKLMETINKYSLENNKDFKRHVIVIPSSSKQYMSDKIPYVFRQNTDFLYLTGCLEPDSCLVLTIGDLPHHNSISLFVREKDSHAELWDGPRTGVDEAVNLFGVNRALPMSELGKYIQSFTKSSSSVLWYDFQNCTQANVHKMIHTLIESKEVRNVGESPVRFVHELRLIKSPAEIELMQISCDIAGESIANTIRQSNSNFTEHQLFATVEYECKMKGADYLAYPPVVAGGSRANIIHYINNNQVVKNEEMVLMDAGCEYAGYSSDITRTWPINGKFTPQQAAVYEVLFNVQSELIQYCSNFPTLDNLFNYMCLLLGKHLQSIGIIPKEATREAIMKMAYDFCPHHVSHYLGMDVHDTPSVSRKINVKPGMIITVEPGVYINYRHAVPREFQGMGIRIEDDILITEDGPKILTKKCPRALPDIEAIAKENQ